MGKKKRKNYEIIKDVILGVEDITLHGEHIKEYYENIRFAYGLLLKGYTQATMIELFEQERGVPYATAWRLLRESQKVFGDQDEVSKYMHRMRASEMALRAYEIAESKGNSGAMTKASMAYQKAWGLDRDDADAPDFSKLETPANILVLDEAVRARLQALPMGGSVDLNNILDEITEDAEYEDVTRGNQG